MTQNKENNPLSNLLKKMVDNKNPGNILAKALEETAQKHNKSTLDLRDIVREYNDFFRYTFDPVLPKAWIRWPEFSSDSPSNALRYIIYTKYVRNENGDMEHEDDKWYWEFASGHSSHSGLEEIVKERLRRADELTGMVFGGFYCAIKANARAKLPEGGRAKQQLHFFGRSDSFGLDKESLEKAIECAGFRKYYDVTVVP